jgi:hypothetical protein
MQWQTIVWIIIVLILIYLVFNYATADINMLNKNVTPGNTTITFSPSSLSTLMDSANFTYSLWFYIEDWNYRYGEVKELIARSGSVPTTSGTSEGMSTIADNMEDISAKQPCPFVMLGPRENNLIIATTCFTNENETNDQGVVHYLEVVNVPIQKWVNVFVSVYGRTLDVYINGKLVRTGILPGPAKITPSANIYLTPNGGFEGWTSKLQYWNDASNPQMAWDTYVNGYGGGLLDSLLGKYKVKVALLEDNKETAKVVL